MKRFRKRKSKKVSQNDFRKNQKKFKKELVFFWIYAIIYPELFFGEDRNCVLHI